MVLKSRKMTSNPERLLSLPSFNLWLIYCVFCVFTLSFLLFVTPRFMRLININNNNMLQYVYF